MKKEMIISVLVGLFFGLIIVYGVYHARTSISQPGPSPTNLLASPTPQTEIVGTEQLVVHSPEDESIVTDPNLKIAGAAENSAYVVVFVNDEEQILQTDEGGRFSLETELELGSNIIQVYAINEDGQEASIERTVIYTTRPLLEVEEGSATQAATEN